MVTFLRPSTVTHITASFSAHKNRRPPSANPGTDYGAGTGTDVRAPADGKIIRARWSSLVGYYIIIHHNNGWSSDLLHNSKLLVKEGATVKAGQHIAESGGTGSVATGPHIHWSLRPNHSGLLQNIGNVDAEKYVAKTSVVDLWDGWLTDAYVRKLEGALGVKVDGTFSTADIKVLQKKLGVTVDGKFGGNSTKALQRLIGVVADGVVGPVTIAAWKKAINGGKFGVVPSVPLTRTVKAGATANRRSLPTTKVPEIAPDLKSSTAYTVTAFARGEKVSNNDVWFKLADSTWAWSGGFTSTVTTNLPEVQVTLPGTTPPSTGDAAEIAALKAQVESFKTQVTALTTAKTTAEAAAKTAQAGLDAANKKISNAITALK